MDITKMRAVQGPLKERYKKDPETARIRSRAEAILDLDDISCRVETNIGVESVGLHKSTGGDGSKACSADMLLEALAGCAGVTLKAVATSMRLNIDHAKVMAKGIWDARGTLAVDRDAPVGLTQVELRFEIDSGDDPKKIERLIELTERYCVVYQTLANPPALSSQLKIV